MSTTYLLKTGYPSQHSKGEISAKLVEVVKTVQSNSQLIVDEVLRLEPEGHVADLLDYAACYLPPINDLTLTQSTDEDGYAMFRQVASGGGDSRDDKESVRRAFCRLVINEMHRAKMEVCLVVC